MVGSNIHVSQTTPSPSPSLAQGTIDLRNPLPFPFVPWTRASLAAWAASQELYLETVNIESAAPVSWMARASGLSGWMGHRQLWMFLVGAEHLGQRVMFALAEDKVPSVLDGYPVNSALAPVGPVSSLPVFYVLGTVSAGGGGDGVPVAAPIVGALFFSLGRPIPEKRKPGFLCIRTGFGVACAGTSQF